MASINASAEKSVTPGVKAPLISTVKSSWAALFVMPARGSSFGVTWALSAKMPVQVETKTAWRRRRQYAATRLAIAELGSSPARAATKSIVFHELFRESLTASSWFVWILFGTATVAGLSLETRSARILLSSSMSRQLGALKVVPPPAKKPSRAGSRTTTPESTRAVFCSVIVATYGANISGTTTSAILTSAMRGS